MTVFHFNQNSITTTQKGSPSYYFDLAANLSLFIQLSLIPKCIQLLPKKTKVIKTHKGLKNNQLWNILRKKIRSLKRRRRLGLWGDNTIKFLPSNSRDLLHCSSFIFFIVLLLFSFLLNISSFIFLCYLINE